MELYFGCCIAHQDLKLAYWRWMLLQRARLVPAWSADIAGVCPSRISLRLCPRDLNQVNYRICLGLKAHHITCSNYNHIKFLRIHLYRVVRRAMSRGLGIRFLNGTPWLRAVIREFQTYIFCQCAKPENGIGSFRYPKSETVQIPRTLEFGEFEFVGRGRKIY